MVFSLKTKRLIAFAFDVNKMSTKPIYCVMRLLRIFLCATSWHQWAKLNKLEIQFKYGWSYCFCVVKRPILNLFYTSPIMYYLLLLLKIKTSITLKKFHPFDLLLWSHKMKHFGGQILYFAGFNWSSKFSFFIPQNSNFYGW